MQFQLETTDGPAQIGYLTVHNQKIKTPNILFPSNSHYQPSFTPKAIISNCTIESNDKTNHSLLQIGSSVFSQENKSKQKRCLQDFIIVPEALPNRVHTYLTQFDKQHDDEFKVLPSDEETINEYVSSQTSLMYIVSNSFQLWNHPQKFVSYIIKLRKKSNYDSIVFLPRIATVSNLALLCYIGADLFDGTTAILASRHKKFFLPDTTTANVSEIIENPCVCPICSQTNKHPSSFSFTQLLHHNYYMLQLEIITVRQAIHYNRLRDLVEKRIRHSPELVNILRYIDTIGSDYLEQRTPVCMPENYRLLATSREAGFRPEIKRFQQRIHNRYRKPIRKNILLLLPCSAKKPYSFSKSHQRFHQAITKVSNHSSIHEVIITSPIGLVPRELELTYPASSYDISVTGTWYDDEKQMIQSQLDQFLQQNKYDTIVSHLPPDLVQPPKHLNISWQNSITNEKATSYASLNKLTTILKNATKTNKESILSKSDQRLLQVQAIATYQFGSKLAYALTNNCVIKGKYPYLKLFDEEGQQLGMIPDGRGLISLTAEGGKKMIHLNRYTVNIDTGFTVKGSILSPGVISADEIIRKGDDVLVIQGEKYLGVGSATMNGVEMTQRTYGEAVNIRHKIKK